MATSPSAIRIDGELAGEVLEVGLRLAGLVAVGLELDAVAVGLPVLRQQDQRRGVGGLQSRTPG